MPRSILTFILALLISIPTVSAQESSKKATPISTNSATNPSAKTSEAQFKDWASRCVETAEKVKVCFIFQNLLLSTNKQRLLNVRVGRFSKDKTLTALFTLPLGVSLPGGVSLKIDDRKKIRIRYERCDKSGCLAPLTLRDEQVKAFQTGLKAQVAFFDIRGREISIPVSLLGFTAGLKSLNK